MLMIFDKKYPIPDAALREGAQAPQLSLPMSNGSEFNLNSVLENGPVLLNFIKGTWCKLAPHSVDKNKNLLAKSGVSASNIRTF